MVCKTALPDGISKELSIIIFFVNLFLPGIGTIVAGTIGSAVQKDTILVGIAQFITTIIGIGWIWAVVWSVFLYNKASTEESTPLSESPPVPVSDNPDTTYGGTDV